MTQTKWEEMSRETGMGSPRAMWAPDGVLNFILKREAVGQFHDGE